MKNIFKNFLFPFFELYKGIKAIDKKINNLNSSTSDQPYPYEFASTNENLKEDILIDTLKDTIENKKILEDKAKASLIAITISATLIFSIIKYIQDINNSLIGMAILAIISFFSLSYMIIAGILSLYSIGEINTVSIMFPEDYILNEKDKKIQIADNIEYNYLHNLKRNNFMTTSYKCMITSISSLIVIFVISTIISFHGHTAQAEIAALNNRIEDINNTLASYYSENNTSRDNILSIQKTLSEAISENRTYGEKLEAISLSVEKLNQILEENPNQFSSEIRKIFIELKQNI